MSVLPAELTLDLARPDDAGEMWTVQRAAYLSEAQTYGDPFIAPLVEAVDQIRAAIVADGTVAVVARVAGRVVGAVRAQRADRTALIGKFSVAPHMQGRGVGTALLADVEARVAADVDRFTLFTGHLSESNLRLYRRLGYRETHRERMSAHLTFVHMAKASSAVTPLGHVAP